jgi:hypothetical protein
MKDLKPRTSEVTNNYATALIYQITLKPYQNSNRKKGGLTAWVRFRGSSV